MATHFIPTNYCTQVMLYLGGYSSICPHLRRDNGWSFCSLEKTNCCFHYKRNVPQNTKEEKFLHPTTAAPCYLQGTLPETPATSA